MQSHRIKYITKGQEEGLVLKVELKHTGDNRALNHAAILDEVDKPRSGQAQALHSKSGLSVIPTEAPCQLNCRVFTLQAPHAVALNRFSVCHT